MTPVAVVTGAGAGTGRAYVELLLADGLHVVAVSLIQAELDDLVAQLDPGDGRLVVTCMDLAQQDAAEKLVAWLDEASYEVETLVNNAGFAVYGNPTEVDLGRVESMVLLNVVTCTKLSMLIGRRMKARGSGRILIMGSTAGYVSTMRLGAYCASKAYTNLFAFSLAAELRPAGVTVTCVTPGSFQSKFADTAEVTAFSGPKTTLQKIYEREKLDAPAVARAGYRAMKKNRTAVVVGSKGVMAKVMGRVLSPAFVARLSRTM